MFFIHAMVQIFSFGERLNVLSQLGFASLNRTFNLSPHENIRTIALITIHYLYSKACIYIYSICKWALTQDAPSKYRKERPLIGHYPGILDVIISTL